MEFNWENFKNGKIRVNCRTKEEAEKFIDMCYNNGICWCVKDDNERTYWLRYKENTYYSCMDERLVYGDISCSSYAGDYRYRETYKFKDVTNIKIEEDNKMELKEGMIVECRNGDRYLLRKVEDKLLLSSDTDWLNYIYDNNFIYNSEYAKEFNGDFDIMKIYESKARVLENLFVDKHLTCIWERKEPKKMTLAQISEALGYEVEIIDNE